MSGKHLWVPKHALALAPGSDSAAARRRVPSLVKTVAVIAAGVVVGVAGSAGTYAAWNGSAVIPGATVKTGSTTLQVQSVDSSWSHDAVLNQVGADLPQAGGSVKTTFVMRNNGTTGIKVTLTSISKTSGSTSLYNALQVYLKAGACTSAQITTDAQWATVINDANAVSGNVSGSFSTSPALAQNLTAGSQQTICLAFHLPSTSSGLAGTNIGFRMNLNGAQTPR
jgi:hypothetical protein